MSALSSYKGHIHLMRQIHEASYYIGRAEELGHPHLWHSYPQILEFLGHFKSALNSYAKCFVRAGDGRIRLEASSVFKSEDAYLKKHSIIMDLRHNYVAHNSENEFETVSVHEAESPEELVLHLQYGISFPFDRLYELRELIRLVELHIVDRQKVHLTAIEREVGKPVRVTEGNTDTAADI
ncbi:hypothetical protein [Pseudomonas fluorescens]|uniref:hypothetical protein n=1 Tax=Pseudomonas fluorescens TaxID=294 RepID=UPI001BE6704B|nr:hypothetical protein [Pseudomonas fluorescens]MBT2375524.1 hypothetical protein [Pseudomonas fluorescens]